MSGERSPIVQGRRATVSVETLPLWRIRLARRLTIGLLVCVGAAAMLGGARLIATAGTTAAPTPPPLLSIGSPDLAVDGFATEFARAYLTWNANDPQARARALATFDGAALAFEGGLEPPLHGSRSVLWDLVVQERDPRPALRVCTVAVGTQPGGTVYLAVSVATQADGRLALASYPAIVGAPAATEANPTLLAGGEVADRGISEVVERALRNYLAPAPTELAADLAPGARVQTPTTHLSLQAVQRLLWSSGGPVVPGGAAAPGTDRTPGARQDDRTVVAVIAALGVEGARYTLAYEVQLQRLAGRWEVVAIETDSSA
ncbi:MAG: hypothetical protein ACYCSI_06695 [Solirubrobacteraceae bacterium]